MVFSHSVVKKNTNVSVDILLVGNSIINFCITFVGYSMYSNLFRSFETLNKIGF